MAAHRLSQTILLFQPHGRTHCVSRMGKTALRPSLTHVARSTSSSGAYEHRRQCNSHSASKPRTTRCQAHAVPKLPLSTPSFWASASTWRRSAVNTSRCLVGCTSGDFAAMWFLQAHYPGLGVGTVMAISMASGLSTSMLLETALLRLGRDKLAWSVAARTAAGMSFISMITMELAENLVDYHLTGGTVALGSSAFWVAAAMSMAAGFLAPLPYNYIRLRRYGRACH